LRADCIVVRQITPAKHPPHPLSEKEALNNPRQFSFTASDLEILEKLQSLMGLRGAQIIRFALRALLQRIEGKTAA
jgi:hypothetical protein